MFRSPADDEKIMPALAAFGEKIGAHMCALH
jgi:hypothetical protein